MNILPKKRWHVRTKQNIERVRRDEAKAAEEEKELQRRINLAEQEARTELLRKRARESLGAATESVSAAPNDLTVAIPEKSDTHVNFFSDLEDGKKTHGTNKEHEIEKREEQEKFEKSIGLLTYLGQNCAEEKDLKPWYFDPPSKRMKREVDSEKNKEVGGKSKSFLDPLKTIHQYVGTSRPEIKPTTMSRIEESYLKHKMKRLKKDKKKHKRKHKDKKAVSTGVTSSGKSLAELRMERLRRERTERLRVEQLMAKASGQATDAAKGNEKASFEPRYNSQYNPHLARQSRKD